MLIECPECGARVSSHADACTTCGYPLYLGFPVNPTPETRVVGLRRVERVVFGEYHGEPISWVIAQTTDTDEGLVLLISERVLATRPYDSSGGASWTSCDLRSWLSDGFALDAFSDTERAMLEGEPFVPTSRQVFSSFPTAPVRIAWPASSAMAAQGEASPWWTSTGADADNRIAFVRADGKVDDRKGADPRQVLGVRVAVWISPHGGIVA